jgi:hypothetical protein
MNNIGADRGGDSCSPLAIGLWIGLKNETVFRAALSFLFLSQSD